MTDNQKCTSGVRSRYQSPSCMPSPRTPNPFHYRRHFHLVVVPLSLCITGTNGHCPTGLSHCLSPAPEYCCASHLPLLQEMARAFFIPRKDSALGNLKEKKRKRKRPVEVLAHRTTFHEFNKFGKKERAETEIEWGPVYFVIHDEQPIGSSRSNSEFTALCTLRGTYPICHKIRHRGITVTTAFDRGGIFVYKLCV